MPVWTTTKEERSGYLFNLSDAISIVEARHPNLLVPLDDGVMLLVSDYSGQHKRATHEAYSFLITTNLALNDWMPSLTAFRARWLPDGRRISFKALREPVRRRALVPFLETASLLRANLITVMVDRRVGSFLGANGPSIAKDIFPDCFPSDMSDVTVEKMLRVAGLLAMMVAGLRKENQESNWISDHDEILDSFERREQFGRLASYLTQGLTRWQAPATQWFGTTEVSGLPNWVEDTASIPDLVAACYCVLSPLLPYRFSDALPRIVVRAPVPDERAAIIGNWLAGPHSGLHPVLTRLELDQTGAVRATAQVIEGRSQA